MQNKEIKITEPIYGANKRLVIKQGTPAAALLNAKVKCATRDLYAGQLTLIEYKADNNMAKARKVLDSYPGAPSHAGGEWNGQTLDEKDAWNLFHIMEKIYLRNYIGERNSECHYEYADYGRILSKAAGILARAFNVGKSETIQIKTFEKLADGHSKYLKRCLAGVSKMLREKITIKIPSETLSTCGNVKDFYKMRSRRLFTYSH
ncbi:MAG: hypothetical protein LBT45_00035 [Rickettsiales bacterium]|jgi:hypothetical protein|nr:hypothetical protein [Rickettsiales bacterium]